MEATGFDHTDVVHGVTATTEISGACEGIVQLGGISLEGWLDV